ncbi:MAG: GNAT family N-acetyltransferase [Burkholderiales bacterium]|jgi:RimJ/RimL family protein N-acetyltransferase|nr:GNAT family N-acetyltransferase [Burkholderiales bacterium]
MSEGELPLGPEVDPRPAPRPQHTVLAGRFCTLRPLEVVRDSPGLYASTHGGGRERLWAYLFSGPFAGEGEFSQWLAGRAASEDPLFFAIEVAGEALGWASLMRITPEHRVIEVGNILFTPRLQRTPAATEAMYLLARHAFDALGYRRYEWKCNALNAASRAAALRLGFSFEGIFRNHMIVKGRSRDTAWFAMTDADWPSRKAAFERWLDPANFDGQGRQRAALAAARLNAA